MKIDLANLAIKCISILQNCFSMSVLQCTANSTVNFQNKLFKTKIFWTDVGQLNILQYYSVILPLAQLSTIIFSLDHVLSKEREVINEALTSTQKVTPTVIRSP